MKKNYTFLFLMLFLSISVFAQEIANTNSPALANSRISACNINETTDTLRVEFSISDPTNLDGGKIVVDLDDNIEYVAGSFTPTANNTMTLAIDNVSADNNVVTITMTGVTSIGQVASFTVNRVLSACSRPFTRPLVDEVTVLDNTNTVAAASGANPFLSNPYNQDFPQLTLTNASVVNNNTTSTEVTSRSMDVSVGSGDLAGFTFFETFPAGEFTYVANSFQVNGVSVEPAVSVSGTQDTIFFVIGASILAEIGDGDSSFEDGETATFTYDFNWENCYSDRSISSRVGISYGCDGEAPCQLLDAPLTSRQVNQPTGAVTFQLDNFTNNVPTCIGDVVRDTIDFTYTGEYSIADKIQHLTFILYDSNANTAFFSNVSFSKNGSPISLANPTREIGQTCSSATGNSRLDNDVPGPFATGDTFRVIYDWQNCVPPAPTGCVDSTPQTIGALTRFRAERMTVEDICGNIVSPFIRRDVLLDDDRTPVGGGSAFGASLDDTTVGDEILIKTNASFQALAPLADYPNQTVTGTICLSPGLEYTGVATDVRYVQYDAQGVEVASIQPTVSGPDASGCYTVTVDPIDAAAFAILNNRPQLQFPVDVVSTGSGQVNTPVSVSSSFGYSINSTCAELPLGCVEQELIIFDPGLCSGDLASSAEFKFENPTLPSVYSTTFASATLVTDTYASISGTQKRLMHNDDLRASMTGSINISSGSTYNKLGFYLYIPNSDLNNLVQFVDGSAEVTINGTPEDVTIGAPQQSGDTLYFDITPSSLTLNQSGTFTAEVNFKVSAEILNDGTTDVDNFSTFTEYVAFITNSTNSIPLASELLRCGIRYERNRWYSTAIGIDPIQNTYTRRQCYILNDVRLKERVNSALPNLVSTYPVQYPETYKYTPYEYDSLVIEMPDNDYELYAAGVIQSFSMSSGGVRTTIYNNLMEDGYNPSLNDAVVTSELPIVDLGGGKYYIDISTVKANFAENRTSEVSEIRIRLLYRLKNGTMCNLSLGGSEAEYPTFPSVDARFVYHSPLTPTNTKSISSTPFSAASIVNSEAFRQANMSDIMETLTTPNGTVTRSANVSVWGDLIGNSTQEKKFFYFFYENKTGSATLDEVTGLGQTVTANANGLFEMGNASRTTHSFDFDFSNQGGCATDTLTIFVGSTCDISGGYPTDPATFCKEDSIQFILEEQLPDFSMFLTSLENTPTDPSDPSSTKFGKTTIDVCEQLPVEVRIESSQLKEMFDVTGVFNIPTGNGGNPGMEYVAGSATIAYPSNAAPVSVDAIAEANLQSQTDGSLEFLLEEMLPGTFNDTNGLPGLFDNDGNQLPNEQTEVVIRFLVETTCDFISGSFYDFTVMNADDSCGRDAISEGLANFSSVLQIEGLTPPFEANLSAQGGVVFEGCSDTKNVTFDFLKVSNGAIDLARDFIQISIPSNLTLDAISGSSTDAAINSSITTGDITEVVNSTTGVKTLTWSVPDMSASTNNGAGQTLSYTLTLSYNGTNMCGSEMISSIIYREQELACGATTCPAVINPAGISNETITYSKSQVEITNFTLDAEANGPGTSINGDYDIDFINSTTIDADNLVIELFVDEDDSGAFSAGDVLIGTINVGALPAGATGNRTGMVTYTDDTRSREVFAVVDSEKSENCFCETKELPAVITLPVELVDFSAEEDNCIVHIKWTTATETNNSHFVLERSSNGVSYSEVAIIEGNGTSLVTNNYSYIDSPSAGTWLYRLKQVDFDGAVEYSDIVSTTTNCSNDQTIITPNPVLSEATLFYTTQGGNDVELRIVNMQGQIMEIIEIDDAQGRIAQPIQAEGYAAGVYIIIITDGSKEEQVRFVKQ